MKMTYNRRFLTTRADRIARRRVTTILQNYPPLSHYNIRYTLRVAKQCYACWITGRTGRMRCRGESHS